MRNSVVLTVATDNQKSTAIWVPEKTAAIALHVPTLNAAADINFEVYTAEAGNREVHRGTQAWKAATVDTAWVPLSAAFLSATPGGVVHLVANGRPLAGTWVRVICSVAQIGVAATLTFGINFVTEVE